MDSSYGCVGLGSKRDFQSRHVDLRRKELHLALELLDPAAHVAEFFGDVERILDGRGTFQNLQVLRFFGLSVAKASVQIDVFAGDVAHLYAFAVDICGQALDLDYDLVEASGWNAGCDGCGMAAAIDLRRLLDESSHAVDDGPDLVDRLSDVVNQ